MNRFLNALSLLVAIAVLVALVMLVAGCAKEPVPVVPAALELPAAHAMVPPAPLPKQVEGSDLFEEHGKLRAAYGRETQKVKVLQAYARRVTRKKGTP